MGLTKLLMLCSVVVVFTVGIVIVDGFIPNIGAGRDYLVLGRNHREITKTAIDQIATEFITSAFGPAEIPCDGVSCLLLNVVKAKCKMLKLGCSAFEEIRDQIAQANAEVDSHEPEKTEAHFDAENFVEANRRIIGLKLSARDAIVNGKDFQTARVYVGTLLHTLQDFYSHSNWIEMGRRYPNPYIGRRLDMGPVAASDEQACVDCTTTTCTNNIVERLNQAGILTSGYYGGQNKLKPDGVGKCSHGGPTDKTRNTFASGGINKDSRAAIVSPHNYLHDEAAAVAVLATVELLRDLWVMVGNQNFSTFLGLGQSSNSLAIVMDTTSSMGEEISAAIETAVDIVRRARTQEEPPSSFLLCPFNDPDVGPLTSTDDPDKLVAALRALKAAGGFDEPEMCLSGVLLALQACRPLSKMYVYTDASAKDDYLYSSVISMATKRKVAISFILTTDARRRRRRAASFVNLYRTIASSTGGIVVETTNRNIANASRILVAAGTESTSTADVFVVSSGALTSASTNYSFVVDSSITKLLIEIATPVVPLNASLTWKGAPAGNVTTQSNGDTLSILSVSSPAAGSWLLSLSAGYEPRSSIEYSVKVTALTSVSLSVLLADVNEGGHGGIAYLSGEPIVASSILLVASLRGSPQLLNVTSVAFVSDQGQQTASFAVSQSDDFEFIARVTIPTTPFRALVLGVFADGQSFQRIFSNLMQPSSTRIGLSVDNKTISLAPGNTSTLAFTIFNDGEPSTIRLSSSDTAGFARTISPASVTLSRNASAVVSVTLAVPATTADGQTTVLTIVTDNRGITNYFTVNFVVQSYDPDFTSPTITPLFQNVSCTGTTEDTCSAANWIVFAAFRDTGSGLTAIALRTESADDTDVSMAYTNFTAGNRNTVLARLKASCCITYLELVAYDRSGNINRLPLNVSTLNSTDSTYTRPSTIAKTVQLRIKFNAVYTAELGDTSSAAYSSLNKQCLDYGDRLLTASIPQYYVRMGDCVFTSGSIVSSATVAISNGSLSASDINAFVDQERQWTSALNSMGGFPVEAVTLAEDTLASTTSSTAVTIGFIKASIRNYGAIIAGAVGGGVGLIVIIALLVYCLSSMPRRRTSHGNHRSSRAHHPRQINTIEMRF